MSKQQESSGIGLVILMIVMFSYFFQREMWDKAAENLGTFIGQIIFLSVQGQKQQQPINSGGTRFAPAPVQSQEGIIRDMINAPNPYANSTFQWSPPDISPQSTRCVTGFDSFGRVVTECQ